MCVSNGFCFGYVQFLNRLCVRKLIFTASVISLFGSKSRLKRDIWLIAQTRLESELVAVLLEVWWGLTVLEACVLHLPLFPCAARSSTGVSLSLQTLYCLNWLGILNKDFKSNPYGSSNCTCLKQCEFTLVDYHITTDFQSKWNGYQVSPAFFMRRFCLLWVFFCFGLCCFWVFSTLLSYCLQSWCGLKYTCYYNTGVLLIFTWAVLKPCDRSVTLLPFTYCENSVFLG